MSYDEDDQLALGMLQSAMNFREIFTKAVLGASPDSLETICECLLEYTKVIAAEYGRPQAHYLWGPRTQRRKGASSQTRLLVTRKRWTSCSIRHGQTTSSREW